MSQPKEFRPALCKVGIFAVIGRWGAGVEIEFLVNVRTDQERQRQLAGLPADWSGVIVDLPGGTLQIGDASLEECLKREIAEETGGCGSKQRDVLLGPFELIKAETGTAEKPHDLAFVKLVDIEGTPQPTQEATAHSWVTWTQLEAEQEFRLPGKGKTGRMAKMIQKALEVGTWPHNFPRSDDEY